ncbi:MAG: putative quinol monooxygenase [Pseudomonadota bacterium]
MIYVIAELTFRPGTLADVMEEAQTCIAETRKEDGCIAYDVFQSKTDQNQMVFVERWRDRAALDAHFKTPHLIAWRGALMPVTTHRSVDIIEAGEGAVERL